MEEALQQMRQDLNQLTTLVKASLSNATNGNDGGSLFLPFLSKRTWAFILLMFLNILFRYFLFCFIFLS